MQTRDRTVLDFPSGSGRLQSARNGEGGLGCAPEVGRFDTRHPNHILWSRPAQTTFETGALPTSSSASILGSPLQKISPAEHIPTPRIQVNPPSPADMFQPSRLDSASVDSPLVGECRVDMADILNPWPALRPCYLEITGEAHPSMDMVIGNLETKIYTLTSAATSLNNS